MKALKYLGIAIGVIILLLVIAAAVIASQFDSNHIKAELAKTVLESKQRTLKIDGDLSLSFWPNVGVGLKGVSLSEHGNSQVFASVESARISVAVMPLLSRQISVNAVEVNGAKVTLVQHKDGSFNFDDLLAKAAKGGAGKDGADGGGSSENKPLQVDISGIKVADLQLVWQDEKAGTTTTISDLDLATGALHADSAKKTLVVAALSLSAKGKTGADTFEIKLQAPKVSVSPEKSSSDAITLSAVLSGAQRNLNAKLQLGEIMAGSQALQVGKLVLDLDAKSGETAIKGSLHSSLAGNTEQQTLALEKMTGELEVSAPKMPMKQLKLPINGTLHADLAKKTAAGNLATQFDESKIALNFTLPRFSPFALDFALDVDKLNVDKYLPPPAPASDKAPGEKKAAESELDFSALKALTLNGLMKIGDLQVSHLKMSNIKMQMRAANGKLEVAPHSANLYGGSVAGELSVDANGNLVAMQEHLTGVDINPLMKDAIDKDLMEGRGNVTLDLKAHGKTVSDMKKALAGTAALSLKDGAVKGINLAKSLRDLRAKFSGKQDAVQTASQTEKTDFSELSASFKVANGVAHNDDLAMKSPFLRLGGAGDIDIGNSTIDYLAKASVVTSAAGQGSQDLDYLKGVTVPVRLTGPFEKPSYKIEFAGLTSEVIKNTVKEKLQDKLKDFFKR